MQVKDWQILVVTSVAVHKVGYRVNETHLDTCTWGERLGEGGVLVQNAE